MKTKIVALDPGSSYTKVLLAEGGDVQQFPSLVSQLSIADITPHIAQDVLWKDGVPYLCGFDAQAHMDLDSEADARADAGFHGSEEQEVLFAYIFDELGLAGTDVEVLCQSLPFQDQMNDELVKKICAKKGITWTRGNKEKTVKFDVREVVAQGVGALVTKGYINNPDYRLLIMADIGSLTTDVPILVWHPGKKCHVYHQKSFSSREFNIRKLAKDIAQEIKNIEGLQDRKIGFHDIAEMHKEKRYVIKHGSKVYKEEKIKPIFQKHMHKFTASLEKFMREQVGDELWSRADRVALGGGGPHWMNMDHWKCHDRTDFLDETSNVRGQFMSYEGV